jgi:hypothetical protein
MQRVIFLLFSVIIFTLSGCNSSRLKKEVVGIYKNGNPKKEQFFSFSKKTNR